ncbi:hypothetical protein EVB87_259 [Rhizobium phage RHph_N28_1]|nr:hypothetical protein EVB87_259 [Rhizobium phage RHph_N28_1]QIG74288.1 hypothetical protein EVC07_260 [Rhizobium phage RHph_N42]QIG74897.1 hypothetical protein EVC12_262 [Rhizobium phage RHph_I42]QXV73947.1 hypothetical protein [Rhizobium phage RHph_N46]
MQSVSTNVVYNIQQYKRVWIGVKSLQTAHGWETTVVWVRNRADAANFTSAAFAEEFIDTHMLRNAVVKQK